MSLLNKFLGLAVLTGAFWLANNGLAQQEETSACQCQAQVKLDKRLPMSHPVNRCATQQQQVNWWSWLGGHSGAGQFHYLDLLELLSRLTSDSQSTSTPNP
ncbi:hypothetical protein HMF8227_02744 [Saliniradius amylolyticus]|uniref:Uncharacterized protein n=1 Tax=Saliniradius amylolyticus TaxID=2183582 RepID=A0A2S2E6A3_9ALTE|nr:hypothetical protein [Saliniradius amylolyticus]AWL13195.1 hypothetical protein HMF8227_02744 [Saliniradius amylolyticus]